MLRSKHVTRLVLQLLVLVARPKEKPRAKQMPQSLVIRQAVQLHLRRRKKIKSMAISTQLL